MGWYRSLPDPSTSGIDEKGIRGLYADNSAKPGPGTGIGSCPGRTAKKRAKWKAQYEQNRRTRAALNAEFRGEAGNRRPAEYHSRLHALSIGSA